MERRKTMKEENIGKKVLYGIIVVVIILVIGIIIVNFNSTKTNQDGNITNTVVNEIEEDNPEENPIVKQPEDTERVGVEE